MNADVLLNGETLELHGKVVAIENEVTSQGSLAGYSFVDRLNANNRFVLYANTNNVYFYKAGVGNILTLNQDGLQVNVISSKTLQVAENATISTLKTNSISSKNLQVTEDADIHVVKADRIITKRVRTDNLIIASPILKGLPFKPGSPTPVFQEQELDVLATLQDLQKRIVALEAKTGK